MKRLGLLSFLFGMCLSAQAAAQTPDDVSRSKELFRAGASAYAAGDYLAAIQALDAAYELTPLPAIGFSLAQAERKQYLSDGAPAHLERAVKLYQRYLDEAPTGNRRGDAREALGQLTPLLPRRASHDGEQKAVRPTRLMIISEAPGARISLDDGEPAASPLIREVTPGVHRVRASARGFSTVERDTTAVAGELVLSELRLSELPIDVVLYSPADADVYADGVPVGLSAGKLSLALPAGEHSLSVSVKGRRLASQRVRLVRGQPLSLRVSPELSTQRIVSLSLFCAGGAALSAGLLLSAFAVRAENRAEEFLALRSHQNVSSGALFGYRASVNERDQLRLGSALSFASAAGFFITGLFLHEFDRPRVQERGQLAPARVSFAPISPGGAAGATLQWKF
ncbi:MAG: hypothetical protein QM756_06805 [Polyangiaceae bacterium]